MTKKLFIHAGTHKTGSTSIQMFMQRNREWLLQQGLYYPPVPENSLVPYQHLYVITIAKNPDLLLNYFREASRVSNVLVVSSECLLEFSNIRVQLETLKQIFDEIKIILYLRRQDEWIESMYKEMIYGGKKILTLTFDEWRDGFLKNTPHFHYGVFWHELIHNWSDSFGTENLIIRSYDQVNCRKGNLLKDFLGIVNVSVPDKILSHFPRVNTGKNDRNYFELARICNIFLKPEEKNEFFNKVYSSKYADPYPIISGEDRLRIFNEVRGSNEIVEKQFFNGVPCIFTNNMLRKPLRWHPYQGLPSKLIIKSMNYFQSVNRMDVCAYLEQYGADLPKKDMNKGMESLIRFIGKIFVSSQD